MGAGDSGEFPSARGKFSVCLGGNDVESRECARVLAGMR